MDTCIHNSTKFVACIYSGLRGIFYNQKKVTMQICVYKSRSFLNGSIPVAPIIISLCMLGCGGGGGGGLVLRPLLIYMKLKRAWCLLFAHHKLYCKNTQQNI